MLFACSLALAVLPTNDALAVTAAGDVYHVDTIAAAATLLNSTSLPMHCLARANDGSMLTLADTGGGVARLVLIDPLSGGTSSLAAINLGGVARGASFDADGSLFVLLRPLAGGADRLQRLDMTTFALTDIGATGITTLEDLCIAPEGRIYAWDSGPGGANGVGLVELSRVNGTAVDIAPAVQGVPFQRAAGFLLSVPSTCARSLAALGHPTEPPRPAPARSPEQLDFA